MVKGAPPRLPISPLREPAHGMAPTPWRGETAIRVHPATLTFTPTNWDRQQPVTLTAPEEGDLMGAAITLTHTANGGGHVDVSTTMRLTVVAAHSTEETKAWHLRLGRTLCPPGGGLPYKSAGALHPPQDCNSLLPERLSPVPQHWRSMKSYSPKPWVLRRSPPRRWRRVPPSAWCQGRREQHPIWPSGDRGPSPPSAENRKPSPWMGR